MIQLFGSWCPNCMDEVAYYTQLHKKYGTQGLEIIGIGFEYPTELDKRKERVQDLMQHFNVTYPMAVAGEGGRNLKDQASQAIPQLNHVMSFPTTIFIDRFGKIRKIHTGFYGPGTGKYYNDFKVTTEEFIEFLLAEMV